jgi:hypothetical protein
MIPFFNRVMIMVFVIEWPDAQMIQALTPAATIPVDVVALSEVMWMATALVKADRYGQGKA